MPELKSSPQNDPIERRMPDGRVLHWQPGPQSRLTIDNESELCFEFVCDDARGRWVARLATHTPASVALARQDLLAALYCLFDDAHDLSVIELDLSAYPYLAETLWRRGLAYPVQPDGCPGRLECRRALIWQVPEFWITVQPACYPLRYAVTDGKRHPLRPSTPQGTQYQRYIGALDKTVSFRTLDATDLETFHRWMNTPRVARFWELQGDRATHAHYIETVLQDAHLHPLIGCFDGEPFGYFEAYWAKEDRIAPYYSVDDYDRGLHMLVGEERFRGPHFVNAWLQSLVHYLFLDDPRTRHVVAEPRADNAKMIAYMQAAGFHKIKEFDFPHKRAAMMVLPREVCFDQFLD